MCCGATKPRMATTTEARAPGAQALQQKKPLQGEAYAPQLERKPGSLQLEKVRVWQQSPSTAKNKMIKIVS